MKTIYCIVSAALFAASLAYAAPLDGGPPSERDSKSETPLHAQELAKAPQECIQPKGPPSICPRFANPVGGVEAPVLSCQDNKNMFKTYPVRLFTAPGAPCPQHYKSTPHDLWRACTNACLEQHKGCKKKAKTSTDKSACDVQSNQCIAAIKDENDFKKWSNSCKEFGRPLTGSADCLLRR